MASEKRIKDFEPASDIELDDWFAIDSPSAGTRKVQLAQMLEAIQTQVTAIADELATLDGEVDTHDTSISNLQTKVGSAALTTEAPDLSGGVNELNSSLTNIEGMLPTTATNSGWRIISFPNIKMRILSSAQSITYPANTGSKNFDFTFPSNSFETVYSFQVNASVNGRTDTEVRYVRGSANGCQAYIACGATANTSGTVYITAIGSYS